MSPPDYSIQVPRRNEWVVGPFSGKPETPIELNSHLSLGLIKSGQGMNVAPHIMPEVKNYLPSTHD